MYAKNVLNVFSLKYCDLTPDWLSWSTISLVQLKQESSFADASILCTVLGGEHNRDPSHVYVMYISSFCIFTPRNWSTYYAYIFNCKRVSLLMKDSLDPLTCDILGTLVINWSGNCIHCMFRPLTSSPGSGLFTSLTLEPVQELNYLGSAPGLWVRFSSPNHL